MGVLVDEFGGKLAGELIRASDWNGMLAGIEALVGQLEANIEARLAPLEASLASIVERLDGLDQQVSGIAQLTDVLRQRHRHVTLTAPTTTFAIGQRGLITAQVTNFDGSPLDTSDAASRPWVDFVTVWGTLKAAPGFVTRGGANDRTLSVQVDASGQAQVLLRAEHAEAFDDDEELEIEAVLNTQIAVGAQMQPLSQVFLQAQTPTSAVTGAAYQVVTQAYHRTDTTVMQRYLDTYAVLNPARLTGQFTSRFNQRWRDYRATVLAFVKPDAEPTSPDGASAIGSIQVTFRDWVGPWIIVDYFPHLDDRILDLKQRFEPRIVPDFRDSVTGILNEIDNVTLNKGILGRQRELAAAKQAIATLNVSDRPAFFNDLVETVGGGIGLQQTLSYGEAITTGAAPSNVAAKAIAGTSGKAVAAADRVQRELSTQIRTELAQTADTLRNDVQVSQVKFREELLRDDGVILGVQSQLRDVRSQVEGVSRALTNKADLEFVTGIVSSRG